MIKNNKSSKCWSFIKQPSLKLVSSYGLSNPRSKKRNELGRKELVAAGIQKILR